MYVLMDDLAIVFQSYQDNGRVIMKRCLQCSASKVWIESRRSGIQLLSSISLPPSLPMGLL